MSSYQETNPRLLQHSELPSISPLNKDQISRINLPKIFNLCQEICQQNNYIGLAITEIRPQDLESIGLQQPIHAIFLPSDENSDNPLFQDSTLFLNPKLISLGYHYAQYFEVCGSIADAKIGYFIERPQKNLFDALKWQPKDEEPAAISTTVFKDGVLGHEIIHLQGLTALDTPSKLKDPFVDSFRNFLPHCIDGLIPLIPSRVESLICYDQTHQTYLLRDLNGEIITRIHNPKKLPSYLSKIAQS